MSMNYKTGNAKEKRDKAVLRFRELHPKWTHKEIAEKFGLERSSISRILKGTETAKQAGLVKCR